MHQKQERRLKLVLKNNVIKVLIFRTNDFKNLTNIYVHPFYQRFQIMQLVVPDCQNVCNDKFIIKIERIEKQLINNIPLC